MTDSTQIEPKPKLGAGSLVSQSFSVMFSNLIPIAIVSFIPIVLNLALNSSLLGFGVMTGAEEPDFVTGGSGIIIAYILTALVGFVTYGLIVAMLVQLAYDAKSDRPKEYGRYFKAALATLVPNIVMTLVITILYSLGFILLIVPGLWLMALFSVVIPALVIERAGFGAMSRSRALTRGYRWPIVGALILVGICTILLNAALTFVAGLIGAALGGAGVVIGILIVAISNVVFYGLVSVTASLVYARLREIKEGVSVDELVAVFE